MHYQSGAQRDMDWVTCRLLTIGVPSQGCSLKRRGPHPCHGWGPLTEAPVIVLGRADRYLRTRTLIESLSPFRTDEPTWVTLRVALPAGSLLGSFSLTLPVLLTLAVTTFLPLA